MYRQHPFFGQIYWEVLLDTPKLGKIKGLCLTASSTFSLFVDGNNLPS